MSRLLSAFLRRTDACRFLFAGSRRPENSLGQHLESRTFQVGAKCLRNNKRHASTHSIPRQWQKRSELALYSGTLLIVGGSFFLAYKVNEPFRHTCLAAVRCSRVAGAYHVLSLMNWQNVYTILSFQNPSY